MTTTVRTIVDRLLRTILTPPDAQYAQVALGANITSPTGTVISLGPFTVPEDEALLRQGSLIEADQELMRVVEWNPVTRQATVERGEYSTPASTYTTPLLLTLNPTYPMRSVFEAVRDNITQLYPRLWTTRADSVVSVGANVFNAPDDLMVSLIETFMGEGGPPVNMDARIVDFHPAAGGRAIITNRAIDQMWIRYRRRMGIAKEMTDILEDLGVEDVWATVVIVGAAGDLFVGRDLPTAQTRWVGGVLESENISVGSRLSISGGLAQYRSILIDRFAAEMGSEEAGAVKVHMNSPFSMVT